MGQTMEQSLDKLLRGDFMEKQIENRLRERVRVAGGYALKFISPGCAGVPDRLVFLPEGQLILVELKRPGGKLSPLQKVMQAKFKKLGFKYWVIDSYEGVEEMLSEV